MTGIQPELWVESPGEAVPFDEAAFGATVLHRVGHGDDMSRSSLSATAFWVAGAAADEAAQSARGRRRDRQDAARRRRPRAGRPAVAAGATETSPVEDEHRWRLGRIVDPFGDEWEIGRPLGALPPN